MTAIDLQDRRLEQARERVSQAKARWTAAAIACRQNDPDAPELADKALAELNQAQAALRLLTAPAPAGSWLIAKINQGGKHD